MILEIGKEIIQIGQLPQFIIHSNLPSSIFIERRTVYDVQLEKVSNFDPRNPEACVEYADNDYAQCMDKQLKV